MMIYKHKSSTKHLTAKMQKRPLNWLLRPTEAEGQEDTSVSVERGSRLAAVFLDSDAYLGATLLSRTSELNSGVDFDWPLNLFS